MPPVIREDLESTAIATAAAKLVMPPGEATSFLAWRRQNGLCSAHARRGPVENGLSHGKLTTSLGVELVGVTAPVLLMTWVIEPLLPSETVSRSCQATPATLGDS